MCEGVCVLMSFLEKSSTSDLSGLNVSLELPQWIFPRMCACGGVSVCASCWKLHTELTDSQALIGWSSAQEEPCMGQKDEIRSSCTPSDCWETEQRLTLCNYSTDFKRGANFLICTSICTVCA